MFDLIKNFPKAAIAVVVFVVFAISVQNFNGNAKNTEQVETDTTTYGLFDERPYKGLDDCLLQYKEENASILTMSDDCWWIQSYCDSFRGLQKQISAFESEVELKLAIPKDAADIYKEFIDSHEILFALSDFPNDPFRVAWKESVLAYKYLRVALIEEDRSRVNELSLKVSDAEARLAEMCLNVPPASDS
jgi:hypothetical protein